MQITKYVETTETYEIPMSDIAKLIHNELGKRLIVLDIIPSIRVKKKTAVLKDPDTIEVIYERNTATKRKESKK